MDENQINYILRNKCWSEEIQSRHDDSFAYIGPFGLTLIGVTALAGGTKLMDYFLGIAILGVAIPMFFFLPNRIKKANQFVRINISQSPENVAAAMKRINWRVTENTDRYIIASTGASWLSWGETITLIFDNEDVWFNCKPDGQALTFTKREVIRLRELLFALKTD